MRHALVLLSFLIPMVPSAQESLLFSRDSTRKIIQAVQLDTDNDFFLGVYEDREYTAGGKFSLFFLPFINKSDQSWVAYPVLSTGIEMFTPNIRDSLVFTSPPGYDEEDRPFAGWTYGEVAVHLANPRRTIEILTEVQVGTLGGSFLPKLHESLHDLFLWTHTVGDGWKHQIAPGGIWGIQFNCQSRYNLLKIRAKSGTVNVLGELDFQGGIRMSALQGGLNITNRPVASSSFSGMMNPSSHWSFYWSVSGGIQAVAHNSVLQGPGFLSTRKPDPLEHRIYNDDVERWVGHAHFQVGVARSRLNIHYSVHLNSREYRLNNGTNGHQWAAIHLFYWL